MAVNRFTCLLLHGVRASVVVQHRVQRGRIPGRWRAAKDRYVSGTRVIREREPRRERDSDADGSVRLDPRRADSVGVERIVNQERVVRVRLVDDPLHIGQAESTRLLTMAGQARSPVAAERLLVEELLPVELDAKLVLGKSFRYNALLPLLSARAVVMPNAARRDGRDMKPPS